MVSINGREISKDNDPYIIAEVGVNYDNDMELAEGLIIAAKRAGANAVKFQTYTAERIVSVESPKYWDDDKPDETQFEFFKKSNTFYHEENTKLFELCDKHEITFLSTPFDIQSVHFLDDLGVPAFKVASADITNYPLLYEIAKKRKPVLLSTGASTIGEIEKACEVIEGENNSEIILLHCILSYPTLPEQSNLNMIQCLRDIFPKYEIGWSDHVIPDISITIPTVAVAMGASVIEKHFTLDTKRKGNDHFHSVDEEMLRIMVQNTRIAHNSLGQYKRDVLDIEQPAREMARRSIAASIDIKTGEIFSEENLIMLRPGTGIHPEFFPNIIGLKSKRNVKKGHLIDWKDVCGE